MTSSHTRFCSLKASCHKILEGRKESNFACATPHVWFVAVGAIRDRLAGSFLLRTLVECALRSIASFISGGHSLRMHSLRWLAGLGYLLYFAKQFEVIFRPPLHTPPSHVKRSFQSQTMYTVMPFLHDTTSQAW